MILFDTNVLIDFWKQPEELLKINITPENFAICGPVKTELIHGSKDDDETDRLLGFFQSFKLYTIDEYDWEFTGIMLQTLRQNGYQIPVTDAIIAYTAMKYDIPLWTRDHHFKLMQAVYPELKLYEESM